jgi:hypothetical protein
MTEPMLNPLLGSDYHFNDEAGKFIPAKHERLAEVIHDYDESLDLVLVKSQVPPDPPFALIEWVDFETYIVLSWWQEDELDKRVIEHIWKNDFEKRNPDSVWNEILAKNEAQALLNQYETEQKAAEAWEFGKALLQSPLHTYKHDGKVFKG